MEKRVRDFLSLTEESSERVGSLVVLPHPKWPSTSFYEAFSLRGIRVDRIEPGFVCCSFRVPPRLTGADGNLSSGAIASLVDEVGWAAIHADGHDMKVSVDMSIAYMSTSKLDVRTHPPALALINTLTLTHQTSKNRDF
uniref:Acyl-coenzyme A thioesterase 13 n=1 Tax=Anthurium amnicola TaxID=1678845 RepID=A0A1D1Y372_9ARAE